jgi:hypothetical protein
MPQGTEHDRTSTAGAGVSAETTKTFQFGLLTLRSPKLITPQFTV